MTVDLISRWLPGWLILATAAPAVCAAGPPIAIVREVTAATREEVAAHCTPPAAAPANGSGQLVILEVAGALHRVFVEADLSTLCTEAGDTRELPTELGIDPELRELSLRATATLAATLTPTPSSIEIRRAERVLWRDSSAGCPRPGQVSAQMLTEGARFFLRSGKQMHRFHQAAGGSPFLCERPSRREPLPTTEPD